MIDNMANNDEDEYAEVSEIDKEPSDEKNIDPAQTSTETTSKSAKESDEHIKNSYHRRSCHSSMQQMEDVIRRLRQKQAITNDEVKLVNMKRHLFLSELTFCTEMDDLKNLKTKYNVEYLIIGITDIIIQTVPQEINFFNYY